MSSNPVVKKAVVFGIIQVLLVGTVFAYCCRYVAGMARNKTATQAAFVNPAADDPGMTPVDKKTSTQPMQHAYSRAFTWIG